MELGSNSLDDAWADSNRRGLRGICAYTTTHGTVGREPSRFKEMGRNPHWQEIGVGFGGAMARPLELRNGVIAS